MTDSQRFFLRYRQHAHNCKRNGMRYSTRCSTLANACTQLLHPPIQRLTELQYAISSKKRCLLNLTELRYAIRCESMGDSPISTK